MDDDPGIERSDLKVSQYLAEHRVGPADWGMSNGDANSGAGKGKLRRMAVRTDYEPIAGQAGEHFSCQIQVGSRAVRSHEVVLAEALKARRHASPRQIVATCEQTEWDCPNLLGNESFLPGWVHPDCNVHFLLDQVRRGVTQHDLHNQMRIAKPQVCQHRRQHFDPNKLRDAQPHRTGDFTRLGRGGSDERIGRA